MKIECAYCGRVFSRGMAKHKHNMLVLKRRGAYCSSKCEAKHREMGNRVVLRCYTCNKVFSRPKSQVNPEPKQGGHFCSRKCHHNRNR